MTTTIKPTRRQKTKELITARTFKCGASFTRAQFTRIAKQINPNVFTLRNNDANKMRSNLELVKTQQLINEELAPSGFYLKSAEYQQFFYVVGGKKVKKELDRYCNQAANNVERYFTLSRGIQFKKRGKVDNKGKELSAETTLEEFFNEM